MKKILALSLLCLAAFSAGAQTLDDALNYGDINYYGTARSAALGNAMTAVGGDLGSVGINPAGAAVAGYSQFTVTPGLSISSTQATYAPFIGAKVQGSLHDAQTRFVMPNFGVVVNMDTRRDYGLKNWTFGVTVNTTNVFNERMSAKGLTGKSSMLGELANRSTGIPYTLMGNDANPYRNTALNGHWSSILAYQAYMISPHLQDDLYMGSSEAVYDDGSIDVGGDINQSYFRQRTGSKSDAVINMAFNWNDRFYLGGNIGITSLDYIEHINRYEQAASDQFPAWEFKEGTKSYWREARDRYTLETDGAGIYAKIGFIWLPVDGLRLGGAIQTPTLFHISERCQMDAVCNFDGYNPDPDQGQSTPLDEYAYRLTTPFSFNLGAAYTLGSRALLSADWERTGFQTMRFGDQDGAYQSDWADFNEDIRTYAGVTNSLRAGAELRVTEAFSLRAGYCYKDYAEKTVRPGYAEKLRRTTHTGSIGFGYSSPGSFFVDCAVRYTLAPDSWYYPYDSYEILNSGEWVTVDPPEIGISSRLMDVVLTLGWRF